MTSQQLDQVDATARPLPEVRTPGTVEIWGREVPVVVAASAAGVAALAVVRAARTPARRVPRRGLFRKREKIVGRRSFLIDVHVLGR